MKFIKILICLVILTASYGYGQGRERLPGGSGMPRYYFEALSFQSGEQGVERLDVLIEIPYETLQFVRIGEAFTARCEITVALYDSSETFLDEKFWRETISVKDYEKTISSSVCYVNQKSFILKPGIYIVSMTVKDQETEAPVQQKKKAVVRNYSGSEFAISDILIASHISADSSGLTITPGISGRVGGQDSFYIYFDLYNKLAADSAIVSLIMRNMKGAIVRNDSFGQRIYSYPQSVYRYFNTEALIAGDYLMEAVCIPVVKPDQEEYKKIVGRADRQIAVRWRGMPSSISDLDLAIEQIIYISDREQVEEMRRAAPESKRELFQKFWKAKDPTPRTDRNELMEEYYSRVAYANMNFKYYLEGWKTDMGMIYILFGAPSNIDRHPFEMNTKPYEIWSYYELNREFIFVDISGFGEYRLQNADWDIIGIKPR